MKFVALVSGGKDSILSILLAMRWGHTPVVLGNLCAQHTTSSTTGADNGNVAEEEIDSYMFQTVGCTLLPAMAACMELPLRQLSIRRGQSIEQMLDYTPHPSRDDEVEVLHDLLKQIKAEFPDVTAVVSGAILSHYQRLRVEAVCHRLGLVSMAPLWQCSAEDVLTLVQHASLDARLVKVASAGLRPNPHLGKSLLEGGFIKELLSLQRTHYLHAGGEGGEFETMVVDCPLFVAARIRLDAMHVLVDAEQPDVASAVFQHTTVPKGAAERDATVAALRRFLTEPLPIALRMEHLPPRPTECVLPSLLLEDGLRVASSTAAVPSRRRRLQRRFDVHDDASSPSEGSVLELPLWYASDFLSNPLLRTFRPAAATDNTGGNDVDNTTAVLSTADTLFASIVSWMEAERREPLLLILYCPDMALFAAVNAIYERHVDIIRPPSRAFLEDNTLKHLHVDVWSIPRATATTSSTPSVALEGPRKCLHVQSISPWAAASIGPYAQANRVVYRRRGDNDGDQGGAGTVVVDHTVVSGRIGMVPLTLQLATWSDLVAYYPSMDVAAAPADADAAPGILLHRRRFIAEFMFMVANSLCGLTHFGHPTTDVTHATFFVVQAPWGDREVDDDGGHAAVVTAIQAAWAAAYAVNDVTSPPSLAFSVEDDGPSSEAWWLPVDRVGVVTHARVVLVSKMPKAGIVEVVLERRVGVLDDDDL